VTCLLLIILGAALQGVSNAIVGLTVEPATIFLFLGCAFLVASLTGHLLKMAKSSTSAKIRPVDAIALNVATAVTFGAFYLSLIWIPASLAAGTEAAAAPLTALLIAAASRRRVRIQLWAISGSIFMLSIAFGWSQQVSGASSEGSGTVTGMVLGLIAGAGLAVLATISKRLADEGVTAFSILSIRYHLTYFLAFGCAAANWHEYPTLSTVGATLAWLVLLGFAAVALPLVLIQAGMMRTSPTLTSVIMACVPGISFITESIVKPSAGSLLSWILLFALIVAVCVYGRAEHRAVPHRFVSNADLDGLRRQID
jgi:drug/metabolite transporter (DMT)-like permease